MTVSSLFTDARKHKLAVASEAERTAELATEISTGSQAEAELLELDVSHLITEDDKPVDNMPSAKLQRILVEPLYTNDTQRKFVADANVGIYVALHEPAIVPDMFLSLDVQPADDWWQKRHRSYLLWEFGKPPEVAVEIVSNKRGGELGRKLIAYANMGVAYYVVYDPKKHIQDAVLRVFELSGGDYVERIDFRLPRVSLSLTLWEGIYEQKRDRWLRWCDLEGNLLLTGAELAARENERATQAQQQATQAQQQATQAQQQAIQAQQQATQAQQQVTQEQTRAERLAAQLRALGIEPEA